jgi:hypothetical protein
MTDPHQDKPLLARCVAGWWQGTNNVNDDERTMARKWGGRGNKDRDSDGETMRRTEEGKKKKANNAMWAQMTIASFEPYIGFFFISYLYPLTNTIPSSSPRYHHCLCRLFPPPPTSTTTTTSMSTPTPLSTTNSCTRTDQTQCRHLGIFFCSILVFY